MKEQTPEHEIRRPGWESSEFKTKIVTDLLAAIPVVIAISGEAQKHLPPTSMWFGVAGIVAIIANQINYANNRTKIKVSRNEASAVVTAQVEAAKARLLPDDSQPVAQSDEANYSDEDDEPDTAPPAPSANPSFDLDAIIQAAATAGANTALEKALRKGQIS